MTSDWCGMCVSLYVWLCVCLWLFVCKVSMEWMTGGPHLTVNSLRVKLFTWTQVALCTLLQNLHIHSTTPTASMSQSTKVSMTICYSSIILTQLPVVLFLIIDEFCTQGFEFCPSVNSSLSIVRHTTLPRQLIIRKPHSSNTKDLRKFTYSVKIL